MKGVGAVLEDAGDLRQRAHAGGCRRGRDLGAQVPALERRRVVRDVGGVPSRIVVDRAWWRSWVDRARGCLHPP